MHGLGRRRIVLAPGVVSRWSVRIYPDKLFGRLRWWCLGSGSERRGVTESCRERDSHDSLADFLAHSIDYVPVWRQREGGFDCFRVLMLVCITFDMEGKDQEKFFCMQRFYVHQYVVGRCEVGQTSSLVLMSTLHTNDDHLIVSCLNVYHWWSASSSSFTTPLRTSRRRPGCLERQYLALKSAVRHSASTTFACRRAWSWAISLIDLPSRTTRIM